MTAGGPVAAQGPVTLDPAELQACASLLGIEELPVVLGRLPAPADPEAALEGLRRRRLVARAGWRDEPAPALAALVATVGTAGAELAVRRVGADGLARLCLAGVGTAPPPGHGPGGHCVAARRPPGEDAPVTLWWARSRTVALRRFLGAAQPAACPGVRVPLAPLQERLGAAGSGAASCAAAIAACGVAPADAEAVAGVLASATAWTEVVRVTRRGGVEEHTPAAMVVYDCPHGRMIATPRRAPDGRLWVTFGPAGAGRLARGVDALDALAGEEASARRS